jgi:hypothetical protein
VQVCRLRGPPSLIKNGSSLSKTMLSRSQCS